MSVALLVFYLCVVLVALFLVRELFRVWTSPLHAIPGPTSYHPMGVLPIIIKEGPYQPQLRWAKQYGSDIICYRRLFGAYAVLVLDPELLKVVLVKKAFNFPKPLQFTSWLKEFLGNGLLTSEGIDHARQKKGMSQAFHYQNLRAYVEVFVDKANLLAEWLDRSIGSNTEGFYVNMHRALNAVTLDIIGVTAFGYDFDAIHTTDSTLYTAYNQIFSVASLSLTTLVARTLKIPLPSIRKATNAGILLREKVGDIIATRKSNQSAEAQKKDLLGLMLNAQDEDGKNVFDDKNLVDQVLTFMVAGHETTATALCWTLYLLAQNPQMESKLREELEGKEINADTLSELPYLEAVAKESLRLYPPAPITNRVAKKDVELGKYKIPKGTWVFFSAGVMGRLPAFWDEPDAFLPERWLDKEKLNKRTPTFAWLPFLIGERACIGQKFALLELTSVLAVLIQRFSFSISKEDLAKIRPKLSITLRPVPGMPLTVRRVAPKRT